MSDQVIPSERQKSVSAKSSEEEPQSFSGSDHLIEEMIPKIGVSADGLKMMSSGFSVGTILEDVKSKQLPVIKTEEVQFIPLSLALDYVRRMEGDMKSMHEHHTSLLKRLDVCYADIEKETQGKYKAFIEKWKSQQDDRYGSIRTAYEEEKQTNKELRMWAQNSIQELQGKIKELSQGKHSFLKDINDQMAGVEEQSHSVIKAVEKDYAEQLVVYKKETEEANNWEVCQLVVDLIITQVERKDDKKTLRNEKALEEENLSLKNRLEAIQHSLEEAKDGDDPEMNALKKQIALMSEEATAARENARLIQEENEDIKQTVTAYKAQEQTIHMLRQEIHMLQLAKEDAEKNAQIFVPVHVETTQKEESYSKHDNLEDVSKDSKNEHFVKSKHDSSEESKHDKSEEIKHEKSSVVENVEHPNTNEENESFVEKKSFSKHEDDEALRKMNQDYMDSIKKLEENAKENQEKINLYTTDLKEKDKKIDSLNTKFAHKKEKISLLKQEIKILKDRIEEISVIPVGITEVNPDDDEEKINLRQQLQKSETIIQSLSQDASRREDTIQALEKDLESSKTTIAELSSRIKELQDQPLPALPVSTSPVLPAPVAVQSSVDSEELQKLQAQLEELTKENERLRTTQIPVADDSFRIQAQLEELTKENERLRTTQTPVADDSLRTKLESTEASLQAASVSISEKDSTIAELRSAIQELEKQISSTNSSLDEQVFILKKQLQDREQEHQQQLQVVESDKAALVSNKDSEIGKLSSEISSLSKAKAAVENEVHSLQQAQAQSAIEMETLRKVAGEAESLSNQVTSLNTSVLKLQESNSQKEQELKNSIRQRKLLHNQLEDLKGKIRVFCRVRPMSSKEIEKKCDNVTSLVDEFTLNCETKGQQSKSFIYDSVFGPNSTQEEVFEDTKRLIQSAVDGYNVCIFAYGQTGSGKTYTIQGVQNNPGVTPRAIHELFDLLQGLPGHYNYSVSCYMIEVYLDGLVDLFLPRENRGNPPSLNIKKDPKGMVVIPEARQHVVNSPEELLSRFDEGNSMRHTSSTKMNDVSSRSHLIFGVLIDVTNRETQQRTVGKLSLVDLAGSERVSKTEATAERLKEGRAINKSLTALGDVISALSSGESHVPYRNNKLTMLMSDSLGGTAKTLMFVNISPASYNREETLMSLYYAARVKLITNDPSKNVETKEMSKMKNEIVQLQIERDKFLGVLQKSGITMDKVNEIANSPEKHDFDDPIYDEM